MDYRKFYQEVAEWIITANQMAMRHGICSETFWNWVMESSAAICERYQNNELVLKQMTMLYSWLEDFYQRAKKMQMNS